MKKILYFLLTFTLIFSACGTKEDKPSQNGNTVVISQGAKPKSLDPHMFNEIPGLAVARQFYNCLFTRDENGNVVPDLVDTYEYKSDTHLTLTLKKGVKFHNGDELKADDVVYSIKRMKEKPASSIMINVIDDVKKVDDYTVDILLKQSSSPLLFSLAHPQTSILNKAYSEAHEKELGTAPMGTGPYEFVAWNSGEKIEMKANKNYFKGAPKVDGVTFRYIQEDSSRLAALETGEVDIVYGISPIDTQTIEKDEDLFLISEPSTATEFIGLNNEKEPFNNIYFRQALNYAIDRQSIIDTILMGRAKTANSIVNPQVFGYYEGSPTFPYDVEKAKELIEKSGLKDVKFVLNVNDGNVTRSQVAQIIQANLKDIGIDVVIEILEWGTYLQNTADGRYDAFLGGWISGTVDSDLVLYPLLCSDCIGAAGNRCRYSNEAYDKEVKMAREVTDPKARIEHYKNAQLIISEEAPLIPLFYKNESIGLNKRVKGFKYDPTNMHKLETLELN